MKKFLFIFFTVALSLSLSLSSLALGNEYTFSDAWNSVVFSNVNVYNGTDTVPADFVSSGILSASNTNGSLTFGNNDGLSFKGSLYSGSRASTFTVSIPCNITVNSQQTLTWNLWFITSANVVSSDFSSYGVNSSSTFSLPISVACYNETDLINLVYNSSGGISGKTEVYNGESAYCVTINYSPTSGTSVFESITLSFSVQTGGGVSGLTSFVVGSLGSTLPVSLPSDVIATLKDISKDTTLFNSRILTLINEIRSLQSQVDSIVSSLGSNSLTTNNYYQQILNPSDDQEATLSELEELLTSAKEELAEAKEIINSVQAPTSDDLAAVNTDGSISALNVIESEQTQEIFSSIFSKLDFLTGLILTVLAIATLGYVLYGKKA